MPRKPSARSRKMKASIKRRGLARGQRKALTPLQKKQVVRIVHGQAETKTVAFYEQSNDGSFSARASGLYSQRGWRVQNNSITNNNNDIHQLDPYLQQGTDDNTRIGQRVSVSRLHITGAVRVALVNNVNAQVPTNMKVYLYILQHVSLKDYANLYSQNNFKQFLETGEPTSGTPGTDFFLGNPQNAGMPVAKQYYKVCMRKVITLRYGGIDNLLATEAVSVANCHTWYADYSINLTKYVPKVLQYPETDTSPVVIPTTQNTPTNSSLFMSVGFIDWSNPNNSTAQSITPKLEQTYVSQLSFKDM